MIKKKLKVIILIIILIFYKIECYKIEDLIKINLYKTCQNCDLTNAPLDGYFLKYGNIQGSNVSGANFSGSNLEYSSSKKITAVGTKFNATLQDFADFSGSNLKNADFNNVKATNSKFVDTILDNTNFFVSILINALFINAKFNNTVFLGVNLANAVLLGSVGNYIEDDQTTYCRTIMQDGKPRTNAYDQRCPAT